MTISSLFLVISSFLNSTVNLVNSDMLNSFVVSSDNFWKKNIQDLATLSSSYYLSLCSYYFKFCKRVRFSCNKCLPTYLSEWSSP